MAQTDSKFQDLIEEQTKTIKDLQDKLTSLTVHASNPIFKYTNNNHIEEEVY